MRVHTLLAAIGVFVVVAAQPGTADACQCAQPRADAATELARSEIVVEARVAAHRFVDGLFRTRLTVERTHKGSTPKRFTVVEAKTCAVGFIVGERFLVYASRDANGDISTNFCSRTAPVAEAKEDLDVIAAAKAGRSPAQVNVVLAVAEATRGRVLALLALLFGS